MGQDRIAQRVEDGTVPIVAGDRDGTERLQDCPFSRVLGQISLIRRKAAELERSDSAIDALADLTSHAPVAGPSETQTVKPTAEI
jgi:hypothetical protein